MEVNSEYTYHCILCGEPFTSADPVAWEVRLCPRCNEQVIAEYEAEHQPEK